MAPVLRGTSCLLSQAFHGAPHGPAFVTGCVKVSCVCTYSSPTIIKASCARTRAQPQDLWFLCWQWQGQFISSLTIRNKPRWWWGRKDSSTWKPDNWFYGHPSLCRNSFSENPQHSSSQNHLFEQQKKTNLEKMRKNKHVHTYLCSFLRTISPMSYEPNLAPSTYLMNKQAAPQTAL